MTQSAHTSNHNNTTNLEQQSSFNSQGSGDVVINIISHATTALNTELLSIYALHHTKNLNWHALELELEPVPSAEDLARREFEITETKTISRKHKTMQYSYSGGFAD